MSSASSPGSPRRIVAPTSYGHRDTTTGYPCGSLTAPLYIATQHIFSTPCAQRYFEAIKPDGRLSKADTPEAAEKRAESVREKWGEFQTTNRAAPLRRTIGCTVLDGEGLLFTHQGDDAGVRLMNFLHDIFPGEDAPNYHPAKLVGFGVQDALAIAAFDSAAAGFPPAYWAWNADHRAPNYTLDPYKYVCTTSGARDIIPVEDVLERCGWGRDRNIQTTLGEAEAARHLAKALGLCP